MASAVVKSVRADDTFAKGPQVGSFSIIFKSDGLRDRKYEHKQKRYTSFDGTSFAIKITIKKAMKNYLQKFYGRYLYEFS